MKISSIFREYDIRGIFDKELNESSVKRIGYHLGKRIGGEKIVAVGYDARTHSPTLKGWLASGLNAAGCLVLDMGMVPTPVNYFSNYLPLEKLVTNPEAKIENPRARPDASVMITGSHNPPQYNGFKITLDRLPFFGKAIEELGQEIAADAEATIPDNERTLPIDVKNPYIHYMVEQFSHLKGLKQQLIFDCGNGVAGTVLPQILEALELNYRGLYCEPDGTFPHHHPDPSEEKNLADLKAALTKDGDLGFAYDGDADRIAVLTPRHNIKGDQMALLFARKMDRPTVIGEVKCSQVMYDELERRGAKTIMYKTGHSNLKVKIKETDADLACEVSGHIFFADRYYGFDDAIYATLRLLELVAEGIDLDTEIEALPRSYATEEIKIPTTEERKFRIIEALAEKLADHPAELPPIRKLITVDGLRIHFDEGWALVRASNTTPVLVTRYEAANEEALGAYREAMEKLIEEVL